MNHRERTPAKCFECERFDRLWGRCILDYCYKDFLTPKKEEVKEKDGIL